MRTADYTTKRACGIYEIKNSKGRSSYKIFIRVEDLKVYLEKNKDKFCESMTPVFYVNEYKEYQNTRVQKLTSQEIKKYMTERNFSMSSRFRETILINNEPKVSIVFYKREISQ